MNYFPTDLTKQNRIVINKVILNEALRTYLFLNNVKRTVVSIHLYFLLCSYLHLTHSMIGDFFRQWAESKLHISLPVQNQAKESHRGRGGGQLGVNGDRSCDQQRLVHTACLLYPRLQLSCLVTALMLPLRPP